MFCEHDYDYNNMGFLWHFTKNTVDKQSAKVRLGFLRKVYGIVSAQLLLTTCVVALFVIFEAPAAFVKESSWCLYIVTFAMFASYFALLACRKETPINYILLLIYTMIISIFLGVTAASYSIDAILISAFITLSVTLALTVYTLQSKRDYSSMEAGIYSLLLIFIEVSFLQAALHIPTLDTVLGGFGAALFCMLIVYDTHKMMRELSPEEYMLAAIDLYLDVVNLFLNILKHAKENDD